MRKARCPHWDGRRCLTTISFTAPYGDGGDLCVSLAALGVEDFRLCPDYQRRRADDWRALAEELVLLLRHNQGSPARARDAFRATLAKYDAAKEAEE